MLPAPAQQESLHARPAPRAEPEVTCSIRVVQPFARALRRAGHDVDAWLAPHRLTAGRLAERELRLSLGETNALLRRAVELTGDPALGMHAARCVGPGDFDVVEYAAASSATCGDAIRLAARFTALMHEGVSMQLEVAPPLAALRLRFLPGVDEVPAFIEFAFASLLAYGSRSLGHPTRPLRVELAHSGRDREIYREVFREVVFDAPEHVMWTTAAAMELPHRAPDRSLLQLLTDHADGLLQQLGHRSPRMTERVRTSIARGLSSGHVNAEHTARELAVSLRTLHRKLAEEGTSHGELVDDVRRTQAMQHLATSVFSITEIAFVLGFAHPNAFHKAFKRWTATTPAHYREAALARRPR